MPNLGVSGSVLVLKSRSRREASLLTSAFFLRFSMWRGRPVERVIAPFWHVVELLPTVAGGHSRQIERRITAESFTASLSA
jgi:hypothetical protein